MRVYCYFIIGIVINKSMFVTALVCHPQALAFCSHGESYMSSIPCLWPHPVCAGYCVVEGALGVRMYGRLWYLRPWTLPRAGSSRGTWYQSRAPGARQANALLKHMSSIFLSSGLFMEDCLGTRWMEGR